MSSPHIYIYIYECTGLMPAREVELKDAVDPEVVGRGVAPAAGDGLRHRSLYVTMAAYLELNDIYLLQHKPI